MIATNAVSTTLKSQIRSVGKFMCYKIEEEVRKEALGYIYNGATSVILDSFKDKMKTSAEISLKNVLNLPNITKAIRVDRFMHDKGDKRRVYQNQIQTAAKKYFKSNESKIATKFDNVADLFKNSGSWSTTFKIAA